MQGPINIKKGNILLWNEEITGDSRKLHHKKAS
jgi:hypothetical protein